MRVRFTGKVGLRSGPLYNPGEEADLPDELAQRVISDGFAQRVPPVQAPHPPRAVEEPPVDRMARRGDAHRKSTTHREG